MTSSASPAPSRRKTLLSLGVLALLTGIVVFIFREHWAEISEALSRLTLGQGLLALAVGLSYPLSRFDWCRRLRSCRSPWPPPGCHAGQGLHP